MVVVLVVIFLSYLIYAINSGLGKGPCAYLQTGYKNTETGKCENFDTCYGNIPSKYIKDLSCGN
jgi:hypothetical protein